MERLLAGVAKFRREVFPMQFELFQKLANKQHPGALFITCADSRVVPNLITMTDPGDLFVCRTAGNMVPPYGEVHGGVSATIEYAVLALNVRHIVILGHSDCGAMKGILHPEAVQSMPTVASWLRHGDVARRITQEVYPDLPEERKLDVLTHENLIAQLQNLETHPSVAARMRRKELSVHAWMYYIETGKVEAYDHVAKGFVEIGGEMSEVADQGITEPEFSLNLAR
ncbi:MAG TPA: carbonic anhydrase [Bryobacteraceae bacterium]|jgi:carbonic anhydrase|nr:carbonic anhydrase [Bryobacteraceae bacterium]